MMSVGRLLVVGVWGFPGRWRRARYIPPKPPEGSRWGRLVEWGLGGARVVQAHATTTALAGALQGDWDVSMVIYGLDTLASPPRACGDDELARRLASQLEGMRREFAESPPKAYGDVVDRAERVLRLYVDGYAGEVGFPQDRVEAVVLPGTGTFRFDGSTYVYGGSAYTTMAALKLHLYLKLRSVQPDAIVLDISHGINYLPAIAADAVREVVAVYSAVSGRDVGMAVVNSDPIAESDQASTIHLVEARVVREDPLTAARRLAERVRDVRDSPIRMLTGKRPEGAAASLRNYFSGRQGGIGILDDVIGAVGAIATYGLVLYLVTCLSGLDRDALEAEIGRLKSLLEQAVRDRRVLSGDGEVRIGCDYAVLPSTVDALYLMDLVKSRLLDGLPEVRRLTLEAPGGRRAPALMVDLNDLRKYADRLAIKPPAETIFANEVDEIEARARLYRLLLGGGAEAMDPYSVVYDATETGAFRLLERDELDRIRERFWHRGPCEFNKRNFYAHAGFERNVIAVKAESDGRVLVGYLEECMDAIRREVRVR